MVLQADPVDHQHRQAHVLQPAGHQIQQRLLGARDERAGDCRFRRRPRLLLDLLADRLLPAAVAAGGDAGEHPLQHNPRELIARGEVLIAPNRHLLAAVPGTHPRPLDPNATAAERDLPVIAAVPVHHPVRIMAAPRAAHVLDLLSHQLLQHAQPDTDAQREQSLLRCPTSCPSASWIRGGSGSSTASTALTTFDRDTVCTAVLLSSCRSANPGGMDLSRPTRCQRQRTRAGGPPPQVLRQTGQPR
jgi:hypothetical protein